MIPAINDPIWLGKHSATAINHIITNCTVNRQFKTATLKAEASYCCSFEKRRNYSSKPKGTKCTQT